MATPATKPRRTTAEIADRVLAIAREAGSAAKLPRVRDLATKLGASVVTVDRALTQLEARGFVERRHAKGIYVASAVDQQTIGLVFGRNLFLPGTSPFWNLLLQALTSAVAAAGHRSRCYFDVPTPAPGVLYERDLQDDLDQHRLDAVLLANVKGSEASVVRRAGVPFVSFMGDTHDHALVRPDYDALVTQGVAALADAGCRRIGVIDVAILVRAAAAGGDDLFSVALRAHGLRGEPAWRFVQSHWQPANPSEPFETFEEVGYRAVRQWLGAAMMDGAGPDVRRRSPDPAAAADRQVSRTGAGDPAGAGSASVRGQETGAQPVGRPLPDPLRITNRVSRSLPDGLLITDDMLTRGVLVGLHKAGLVAGRDVIIATLANRGSAALMGHEEELIRLELDPEAIARAMLDQLDRVLAQPTTIVAPVAVPPAVRVGTRVNRTAPRPRQGRGTGGAV